MWHPLQPLAWAGGLQGHPEGPSLWLLGEGRAPSGSDAVKQGAVLKLSTAQAAPFLWGTWKPTTGQAENAFLKNGAFYFVPSLFVA